MHDPAAPATTGKTIRWANRYDTVVRLLSLNREGKMRDAMIALAAIQPGQAVLDVGCGTGELTLRANAKAGSSGIVYGIDASPEMIQVAQRKVAKSGNDVRFQIGVIEALDFPDSTFDVVLSSLMFHHLPDDLKPKALAEVRRVLKPGGSLLIVDIKRALDLAHRLNLVTLVHGNMRSDVNDLPHKMQHLGYSEVKTGNVPFTPLGYVLARR